MKTVLELQTEIREDKPTIENLAREVVEQLGKFIDGGSLRLLEGTTQQVYLADINRYNQTYELMQRIGLVKDIKKKALVIDLHGNPPFSYDICSLTTKAIEFYESLGGK